MFPQAAHSTKPRSGEIRRNYMFDQTLPTQLTRAEGPAAALSPSLMPTTRQIRS